MRPVFLFLGDRVVAGQIEFALRRGGHDVYNINPGSSKMKNGEQLSDVAQTYNAMCTPDGCLFITDLMPLKAPAP